MNVLVVYDTVYGSTAEIAEWLGERLSGIEGTCATVARVDEAPGLADFDAVILGSPIYRNDTILPTIASYVKGHASTLAAKKVGIFVVALDPTGAYYCGRTIGGVHYLEPFAALFSVPPLYGRVLGGEQIPTRLSPEDRASLDRFYKKVKGLDRIPHRYAMEKPKVWEFADRFLRLVHRALREVQSGSP